MSPQARARRLLTPDQPPPGPPLSRAEVITHDQMARVLRAVAADIALHGPETPRRAQRAAQIALIALVTMPADLRRHLGETLIATADRGTAP